MMVNGILFLRTGENKGTFHVIKKAWLPQTTTATIACSQTRHTHVQIIYCIFFNTKKHRHTITTPSPHQHSLPPRRIDWNLLGHDRPGTRGGASPLYNCNSRRLANRTFSANADKSTPWLKKENSKEIKKTIHQLAIWKKKNNFQFIYQILKQTFWGVTID